LNEIQLNRNNKTDFKGHSNESNVRNDKKEKKRKKKEIKSQRKQIKKLNQNYLMLKNLNTSFEKFVKDSRINEGLPCQPLMNDFQRSKALRLSELYNLKSKTYGSGKRRYVVLFKTKSTTLPSPIILKEFRDKLIEQYYKQHEQIQKSFKQSPSPSPSPSSSSPSLLLLLLFLLVLLL